MNMGKKILFLFIVLFSIPLLAALFITKDYVVEREIIINKPSTEVFNFIKLLKNQELYSKWATMDTEMKRTYKGTDGTVGFIAAWDSLKNDVGMGEQEIIGMEEGSRIDTELRFIKPFESKDNSYLITKKIDPNTTKVIWGFKGHMNYPMNLMLVFMDFQSLIGNDFSEGLQNLKVLLEKKSLK
jgi:hypothetical protein